MKTKITLIMLLAALSSMCYKAEAKLLGHDFSVGKTWKSCLKKYSYPDRIIVEEVIDSTIVDGIVMYNICRYYEDQPDQKTYHLYQNKYSIIPVREDGVTKEINLLDLKKGDKFSPDLTPEEYCEDFVIAVVEVDVIKVRGYERKRLTLAHEDINYIPYFYYVEGIGTNIPDKWYCFGTSQYMEFDSVYDKNGECIFTLDDFTADPAGIDEITVDEQPKGDGKVYDLSGREVTASQIGTIYIKDRKKFLKK